MQGSYWYSKASEKSVAAQQGAHKMATGASQHICMNIASRHLKLDNEASTLSMANGMHFRQDI